VHQPDCEPDGQCDKYNTYAKNCAKSMFCEGHYDIEHGLRKRTWFVLLIAFCSVKARFKARHCSEVDIKYQAFKNEIVEGDRLSRNEAQEHEHRGVYFSGVHQGRRKLDGNNE
jgi:hypothetical protein